MAYDMCVFQNSTPCVGGYALRVPRYYPPIPEWTVRVKMATTDGPGPRKSGATVTRLYDDEEIYDVTYANADWTGLLKPEYPGTHQIAEVLGSNTAGVTSMYGLFDDQQALTSVTGLTTENVTVMTEMFSGCFSLVSVDLFDTSKVTHVGSMFEGCVSLTTSPLFDTSNVTNMGSFFYNCRALTRVPLFATRKVTAMSYAFYNCRKVTYGALALYKQASGQTTPPNAHTAAFRACGIDTSSGSTQLASIPSDWK